MGLRLKSRLASERPPKGGSGLSSKVFVGGLSRDTGETTLQQLFAQAGEVVSVTMPTDRDTGQPRGFAFVEFSSGAEAEAAIDRLNGYELDGRKLRVNIAEEKRPRMGGFDSSGGYGGGRPGGGKPGGDKPKGSRRNIRRKKRSL